MAKYADVILPLPLAESYTYILPLRLQTEVQVGCRLVVPFGAKKLYSAVVVALSDEEPSPEFQLKEALSLLDERPVILSQQLKLWRWISAYYLCTMGEVSKAALPGGMKMEGNSFTALQKKISKVSRSSATAQESTLVEQLPTSFPLHRLSEAQQRAKDEVLANFLTHDICLLHGVTSSGKTEIYIHLISETIGKGGQVLYLLPEIVLTTQLVERLKAVFGERLGVYHSKYSDTERERVWMRQLSTSPFDIIVGVRSSVFLPFQKLALVIVDEEHETSFKQQEPAPRYHARNVALVLARMCGAKTLLGSATPSVETYHHAVSGKYGLVTLNERYGQVELPEIVLVNVKDLQHRKMMSGQFSPQLLTAMRNALDCGEQVILFRNRRGYAPYIECRACSWIPRCVRCDVSLTFHKGSRRMSCHYCGATYPIPTECPDCGDGNLTSVGYGTERVEDDIGKRFPDARIARMDQDTTRNRSVYEQMLSNFENGNFNILVGTQMVAKGLDIDKVSVVGILNADAMMNFPDFRSNERAYQMMAQVAGRAGRRDVRGLVILQTKDAGSSVLSYVLRNDYEAMYAEQIKEREAYGYPPFCRLTYVYMKHKDPLVVERMANELAAYLRRDFGDCVLGPDVPPVGRVHGLHIRKIMIKAGQNTSMDIVRIQLRRLQSFLLAQPHYRTAQLYYDVDPF